MILDSIVEFQKAGGHTVAYTKDNHIPSIADRKLRLKLIFEELSELADAYGMKYTFYNICANYINENEEETKEGFYESPKDTLTFNQIEALDANCDLSVVVNGAYCINGFTDIAEEAYDETMKSNLSKFCYSLDEALATVAGKDDVSFREVDINGKTVYAFYRTSDNKILKGINYFKPDYSKLLDGSKNS